MILQISIEGIRGPSFDGDIAVDAITVKPGRCEIIFSEEEIESDSHLGLGKERCIYNIHNPCKTGTTAFSLSS